MKSDKIHHIGFIVENLDKALKDFKELYGWEASVTYDFRPMTAWSYGRIVEDCCLKIAMIELTGQTPPVSIEVIEPVSGDSYLSKVVKEGKAGMNHMCFCVKNYDEWKAHFMENNNEILFEAETEDELFGYRRCMYVDIPDYGMVCEIKEDPYFRN